VLNLEFPVMIVFSHPIAYLSSYFSTNDKEHEGQGDLQKKGSVSKQALAKPPRCANCAPVTPCHLRQLWAQKVVEMLLLRRDRPDLATQPRKINLLTGATLNYG
jgi:hypothetical protein